MDAATLERIKSHMDTYLGEIITAALQEGRRTDSLWHYTRPEAFLKIMENQSLRGSHIRFMNDSREYTHATQLGLDAIFWARGIHRSRRAQEVLDALEQNLRQGLTLDGANHVFVASLSGKRDDLSQWRAYGGPEGGISIGLDFNRLMGLATRRASTPLLLPVEYDPGRQKEIARRIIGDGVAFYESLDLETAFPNQAFLAPVEFAFTYMREATLVGSITKHGAFRDENEWRLVKILDISDSSDVKFVAKETLIVPTLDFSLSHPAANGRIPLTEVIVGPGRMADHSAAAIRGLLFKEGYPLAPHRPLGASVVATPGTVSVSASDVPYRVVS